MPYLDALAQMAQLGGAPMMAGALSGLHGAEQQAGMAPEVDIEGAISGGFGDDGGTGGGLFGGPRMARVNGGFVEADALRRSVMRDYVKSLTGQDPRSMSNRVRLADGTMVERAKDGMWRLVPKVRTTAPAADPLPPRDMIPEPLLANEAPSGPGLRSGVKDPRLTMASTNMPAPRSLGTISNLGADNKAVVGEPITAAQRDEAEKVFQTRQAGRKQLDPQTLKLLMGAVREGTDKRGMEEGLATRMAQAKAIGPNDLTMLLGAVGGKTPAEREANLGKAVFTTAEDRREKKAQAEERRSARREELGLRASLERESRGAKEKKDFLKKQALNYVSGQTAVVKAKFKDDPESLATALAELGDLRLRLDAEIESGDVDQETLARLFPGSAAPAASGPSPVPAAPGSPAPAKSEALRMLGQVSGKSPADIVSEALAHTVTENLTGRRRQLSALSVKELGGMLGEEGFESIGSGFLSRDYRHDLLDTLRDRLRAMLPPGLRTRSAGVGKKTGVWQSKADVSSFDPEAIIEGSLDEILRQAIARSAKRGTLK